MIQHESFIDSLIIYLRTHNSIGKIVNYKDFKDNSSINYLSKLIFDTERFNSAVLKEIYNIIDDFMMKSKNSTFESSSNYEYKGVPNEDTKIIKSYISIRNDFLRKIEINSLLKSKIIFVYIVLSIDRFTNYPIVKVINNLSDFNYFKNSIEQNRDRNLWFRGQSDSSWGLMPSYYRNKKESNAVYINKKEMIKTYNESELLNKYSKVFTSKVLNYDFLSYMQHAVGFSPLLDFTKSFIAAMSFAISNKSSVNDFHKKDSAVYFLSEYNNDDSSIDKIIDTKYKVYLTPERELKVKDFIDIIHNMGSLTPNPKVYYLNNCTNDRMKYQQGRFVLFNEFTIYGNNIPINDKYDVKKVIIKKTAKKEIYNYLIRNFPQYNINNMMNPYQFFNE